MKKQRFIVPVLGLLLVCTVACAQVDSLSNGGRPLAWLEIPAVSGERLDDCYALYMRMDGKTQRNYSFLWDEERLTADWVAYPLCRGNIGSGTRSDNFALNPCLPAARQPLLTRGYRPGNAGRYSRGHQIPSADRLSRQANLQTFYGTNMTPQDENLNGGIWNSLENRVRSLARRCDTLYVVSGCTYDGYDGAYVLDNNNRRVAVPTGYYKALLMRNGDSFHACAYRLENRPYGSGSLPDHLAIPLSELERQTGIEFFPLLREIVGDRAYRQIKNEDPNTQRAWGR